MTLPDKKLVCFSDNRKCMFLVAKEIQAIHCTCSKVIDENHRRAVCSAVSGYFAVNIPFFFATMVSLFGAGAF